MALNFIIRRANHKDLPSLIGLLKILFSIESDFEVDESKQRIGIEMMMGDNKNRCIMVAEMNKKVVGMCTSQILVSTAEGGPVALIEDLVVDQEYRQLGVGKELLFFIEKWSIEQGAKRLQLLADRNNTPALEFYNNISWNYTHMICMQKKFP